MFFDETAVWDKARQQEDALIKAHPPIKEMYLLRSWGQNERNPEFNAKFGEPVEGKAFPEDCDRPIHAWWFTDANSRERFIKAADKFLKEQDPKFGMVRDKHEGPLVKKRVVLIITLRFEGKDYVVKDSFGYGYPIGTAIFCWEENNQSCDHNRAMHLDKFHPGVIPKDHPSRDSCGPTYFEVVDVKLELMD